ncbi:type VI secretion system ATPase TssH [Thalassotalea euphylliae]|uniref:Type VI secretion system ATPase TssH n=1 Tax=Thalassotalea euphylliae TaxID=1655234 RepID=A0A3E0TTL9_9GAMM|nr:type VI secretion system ATPase TssH [Thalassotalea euphylliae]REL27687.1 type VI secretion system ATPase TssH [Thalassotalea euphylliae]
MTEISRVSLFGKLNALAYKAIESATVYCKLRGNPYVEVAHWLHQILQLNDSDLHRIIKHFELNPSKLAADITESLDGLPRGASSISDLSAHVEESVERGWVYGSLVFNDSKVRTGYLVIGMLKTKSLRNMLLALSNEFDKISAEQLSDKFQSIVEGSCEETQAAQDGSNLAAAPGEASGAMAPAQMGKQQALAQFTTDLTEQAAQGELDPIVGRDDEIRQLIDILMRRRQNNPILTGEAGVGKTAVVEGFAHRLLKGDVPPKLQGVKLKSLDIGLLQAGASMKGEFENRLKQVIEEVQSSPTPIIMFIDEAHTLIGAGGSAGTGDAANLLKPALARGELKTIAATTWAEYKKHIEKDPALTRRFQVVKVEEPSEDKAILMLRNLTNVLESHHVLEVLDEAIESAVKLSARYIPARQLPDKAVSLLDTACARVAVSQHATPAELEDTQRNIEHLHIEREVLSKEQQVGQNHQDRITDIDESLEQLGQQQSELNTRWQSEKALFEKMLNCKQALRKLEDSPSLDAQAAQTETMQKTPAGDLSEGDLSEDNSPQDKSKAPEDLATQQQSLLAEIASLQQELNQLQAEQPLVLPCVDEQAVASVVADWTGVPVGRMVKDEVKNILNLANILNQRVIGQDHAMEMIAKRVQTSRAGLDNPNKPIGVFMLCGPSGVGKTESALALAEAMYGGEQNVITINMSEFQEAHTVSTLKGAPPGYVGYGEGGILTEAVRRNPYSVVLLDEVEKAHPDVHEIFFQVFDKGVMEDGEGRRIDFKNTLILLTSNVGSDLVMNLCKDPELLPEPEGIVNAMRPSLLEVFPAALLGRIVTIPYYPLSDAMLSAISKLQLDRIKRRVNEQHGIPFEYSDAVLELIVTRCNEAESGGRMIDAILTNTLLPEISHHYLSQLMEGNTLTAIKVDVADNDFEYKFE